jgi:hypothetical protein
MTNSETEALFEAVLKGDLQHIQKLTLTSTALQQRRENGDKTALHLAAAVGHAHVVAHLLSCGAAVDAADSCGCTPLHLAAQMGYAAATQELIAAKANVQTVNGTGDTPLHLAAAAGRVAVVAQLLQAKASVHAGNHRGARPLHCAALHGRTAVVMQLLAAGAAASVPDEQGLSALHQAAAAGHAPVVSKILQQQPLPSPELQLAVCFADVFGHAPVLAQLLMQLTRQDGKAAATVLGQVAQGPRAPQQLLLAMLAAWREDTDELVEGAQAIVQQQHTQAKFMAGLRQLTVSLAAAQLRDQQQSKKQKQQKQEGEGQGEQLSEDSSDLSNDSVLKPSELAQCTNSHSCAGRALGKALCHSRKGWPC